MGVSLDAAKAFDKGPETTTQASDNLSHENSQRGSAQADLPLEWRDACVLLILKKRQVSLATFDLPAR